MTSDPHSLSIELSADISWISAVQGAVEGAAPVMGLEKDQALRLSMACEEILVHLSKCTPGTRVRVYLDRKPTLMRVSFLFAGNVADLWAMNLTAAAEIALNPEKRIEQVGLMLASRMVDHFNIHMEDNRVRISLYKDLNYPTVTPVLPSSTPLNTRMTIDPSPKHAVVTQACAHVLARYPAHQYPVQFTTPGKVVDMVEAGSFFLATIMDSTGIMGGTIAWENMSEKTIRFFGPYVFDDISRETISRLLIEHLINQTARTPAVILISDMFPPESSLGFFERLTATPEKDTFQPAGSLSIWFRHLREDMGCRVWSHPDMVPFLKDSYQRLFMTRTIQEIPYTGHHRPARSLFGVSLDKTNRRAFLEPMLDGTDFAKNIQAHLQFLLSNGFEMIFFSLDLSEGWQSYLAGDLSAIGFRPLYVLPYSGISDNLVFQYVDPAA